MRRFPAIEGFSWWRRDRRGDLMLFAVLALVLFAVMACVVDLIALVYVLALLVLR